jgi:hypothetical protein
MHRLSGRDKVDLQHVRGQQTRLLVGPTAPPAERSRQTLVSWPSTSVPFNHVFCVVTSLIVCINVEACKA